MARKSGFERATTTPSARNWNGDEVLPPRVQERMRVRVAQHVRREEELRVHRLAQESHADLGRQPVALSQIASEARRDDVRPARLAATRARNHVVHREPLPAAIAVLTGVAVAPED